MDRIDCMRAFVEAVRVNGFAAAARSLDVPRSKVSKQIQALEEMVGVQLLMRTTRSLHLTAQGAEYFDSAQEILASLDEAEERARAGVGQISGVLKINAPLSFGTRVLAPLLPEFHRQNRLVELQVSLTDQLIDPVRGGFDVTIRIANLADSSLAARRIMPADRLLVASPEYLATTGTPQRPEDLAHHSFLHYGCTQGGTTLPLKRGSETVRVQPIGPAIADNGDVLATLAEAGMGITLLPRFIVDEALRAGRLVPILPEWKAPPIAVNALYPAAKRVPKKTRGFIDFLVERLGTE